MVMGSQIRSSGELNIKLDNQSIILHGLTILVK